MGMPVPSACTYLVQVLWRPVGGENHEGAVMQNALQQPEDSSFANVGIILPILPSDLFKVFPSFSWIPQARQAHKLKCPPSHLDKIMASATSVT